MDAGGRPASLCCSRSRPGGVIRAGAHPDRTESPTDHRGDAICRKICRRGVPPLQGPPLRATVQASLDLSSLALKGTDWLAGLAGGVRARTACPPLGVSTAECGRPASLCCSRSKLQRLPQAGARPDLSDSRQADRGDSICRPICRRGVPPLQGLLYEQPPKPSNLPRGRTRPASSQSE